MRKKELLAEPPVMITKADARKNKVVLSGRILRTSEGRVLETDVWKKGSLVFRHYSTKKDWWTYCSKTEEWNKWKLGSLLAPWMGGVGNPDKQTQDYMRAVKQYCRRESSVYGNPYFAVERVEDDISDEKRRAAFRRKVSRISDGIRSKTPSLPKDFSKFVKKIEKKCKEKAWAHVGIQMYQDNGDGYVERQFILRRDQDLNFRLTEVCRGFTSEMPGGWWNTFAYALRGSRYGNRQEWIDRRGQSCIYQLERRNFLYTGNLEELGYEDYQIEIIKKLSDLCQEAEWSFVMREVMMDSILEHLLKAGLEKLAIEYVRDHGTAPDNVSAKRLDEYYGITPQQLAYLKEIDGGWRSIKMLRADEQGKLRPADLKIIERTVNTATVNTWAVIISKGLPFMHVYKLFKATHGSAPGYLLSEYRDYLDLAEERGSDIHDEIIYRNKRWKEFHDRYVEEINAIKEAEKVRRRMEECEARKTDFIAITKDYKRNKKLFSWEKDGYCIEVPHSYKDIVTEGQLQHHCVGATDRYMLSMARRESFILFLRKTEDRNTPYYTIEATEKGVLQFYGAYDRQPDKKQVEKILADWMSQVRKNAKKMRKEEAIA